MALDVKKSDSAIFDFLRFNNDGRGINNGGFLTLYNKTVIVYKGNNLTQKFDDVEISIRTDIPSGHFYLCFDDDDIVNSVFHKAFIWPTKYNFDFNGGRLNIDFENLKIEIF